VESLLLVPQEVKLKLDSLDEWATLRNAMREIASKHDEWAGIPMVLDAIRLVLEPTYPYVKQIATLQGSDTEDVDNVQEITLRNSFWSWRYRQWVLIWEYQGKIVWTRSGRGNDTTYALGSLTACDAWGIEQESNAIDLLTSLVTPRQLKHYLLTGSFIERSKRSNLLYVFRRLRPTLAVSLRDETNLRILCALCMHPIGYYDGSWAGAMVPTDDVIAHLMLMRGDEHMFWRRCNQHQPWTKEAGV
jgi:hypothetical protein